VKAKTPNAELMTLCHAHGVDTPESGCDCTDNHAPKPRVTGGITDEFVTPGITENGGGVTDGITGVTVGITPRARGEGFVLGLNTEEEIQKNNTALTAFEPRAPAPATARVTPAGAAGMALKAGGLIGVNTSHPRLLALLTAGVSPLELQLAATEAVAKGKGFAYALAMVEGRRRDAEAAGPLPGPVVSRRDIEAADRLAQWTGGILGKRKP
jgi:hypothetical protein